MRCWRSRSPLPLAKIRSRSASDEGNLTVKQLRAALGQLGLATSGLKAALSDRLNAARQLSSPGDVDAGVGPGARGCGHARDAFRIVFFAEGQPLWSKLARIVLAAARPLFIYGRAMTSTNPDDPFARQIAAYVTEGVVYLAAYAIAIFYVDETRRIARPAADDDSTLGFPLLRWRATLGQVRCWARWLAAVGFVLQFGLGLMSYHCSTLYMHKQDCRYNNEDAHTMVVLHCLFYVPLWALLALWVEDCGEHAAVTWKLIARCKAHALHPERDFEELWNDTRSLHTDAVRRSKWWNMYAVLGFLANIIYLSTAARRLGPDSSSGGVITMAGVARGIDIAYREKNIGVITGLLIPVILTIVQVGAAEAMPNFAESRLLATVWRLMVKHGCGDEGWRNFHDMVSAQRNRYTFKFPGLGRYSYFSVLRCKFLQEVVFKGAYMQVGTNEQERGGGGGDGGR